MAETLIMMGVRSLGRELALHFAARGWEVICAARTASEVEEVARAVDRAGGKGVPVVCDLTDPASLAALRRPRVDLCIVAQTAGGRFGSKPMLEIDREELARGFAAYVQGTWNLLQAIGPLLLQQRAGTFLQIGTSSGVRTKEGFAALGANQAALRALVQVAAKEWRSAGVHVAYLPIDGPIESERTQKWAGADGIDRLLPPSAIAAACEYLHRQPPRAWTHELLLRPQTGDWSGPT